MNPALPVPEAAPAATPAAPGSGPPAARRSMFFPPVCPTRASDPAVAEALAAATAAASAARDNAAPAAPAPAAASSKKKRKSVVSPPPQPPPSHEASEPDPLAVLESLSCAGCASCAALRSPPVTGSLAAQPPHRNPLASTLKTLLAENWKRKQEEHQRWFEETGGLENDSALRDRIMQLRAESEAVATVRKDRIFDSDITEEESVIIQRRVELQRLQFQEYQRREHARKIARVQYLLNHVTKDEAEDAIKETGGDESQAVINFTAHGFLVRIRKAIAARSGKPLERTEEEQAAYNRLLEKRRIAARKITSEEVKKRSIKYSRLKLDDALDQLKQGEDPNTVFMGWSEARIRSYRQINTKPNSYYYRFNAPGEKQRHGQWTEDEKQLFFARLREVGADGQWGIFSMAIPGRVGYQCSNFYRHLLKTGEVEDSNYMLDDRGELHYLFGKKDGGKGVIRVHSKHGAGGMMAVESRRARAAQLMAAVHDTSSCTHSDQDSGCRDDDDEALAALSDEDNSGTYVDRPVGSRARRTRSKHVVEPIAEDPLGEFAIPPENPLPGFIDPITLEEVVKPAISPYGHVMGYDSWLRCLTSDERKNICPLTKKPLTKRELVVLTHDNIAHFRDKIVNM
nr:hypothetical protein HK105_007235 [Polyrhizophydium stewartii]